MVFNTTLATISHNEKYTSESQRNTIVIILVSTLIAGLVGLTIVTTITGPLKVMESAAQSLAVGDLSKNIKAIGCPEITRAIKGLNKAIDGLSRLVNGINEQASVLFIASKELKEATTETGLSASQIAKTMEELARASTEQAAQVNHAVNTIHLLSDMVVKVSNEMESIAAASGRVAQSAKAGQKATNDVANEINELYNSTKEVAGVIDELNETSVKISEITSVIHNIAEQTTLLALNASIEAARAGEHGRGFGVVASETGKLADQSKQAANLIADLVGEMKTRTEHAVEVMSSSTRRAELGKNLATEATVTFEGIFNSLQSTLDEIEAVAVSARQMTQSNEEVMDAIATIAQISEESAAGTEEVSATAEEQNASVEQLIALAENLNQVANNLSQSVAQFQLE